MTAPSPSSPTKRRGRRGRILVVDDDREIRTTMAQILEDEGYAVAEAANGAEALATLRTGAMPGVILLDLMMPVMDGRQFRDEQLRDPDLARIPVVVLTADPRAKEKGALLGAVAALAKPLRLEDLLSVIARVGATPPSRPPAND